ncbi:hypothetical protein [uncultured Methanolobus sp.]|uniref:hypothetical protein n=1 Tax=uncultured Methanolobus sp. TaxID=218300 RepID=UPI002AABBDA8|nr:hypothetical protein [uncultured Methanolobus sp.]
MKTLRIAGLLMLVSLLSVALMASTALADGNITASRSFNATDISAGDSVRVTVDITVGGSTVLGAVSLDETIPAGWSFTTVDNGGWSASETVDGSWLGPSADTFSPGYTTTIVYDLTSSSTSTGTYSVSGLIEGTTYEMPPTDISSTVDGQTDITVTGGLAPGIHLYDGDSFVGALNNVTEGEIIYLHEGTYTLTGTVDMYIPTILIIGDSRETVTITGNGRLRSKVDNTEVYLENFTMEGRVSSGSTCTNVTIKNCEITAGMPTLVGAFLFENSTFSKNIQVDGGNGTIRNCVGVGFSTIANIPSGDTVLVENNEFNFDFGMMSIRAEEEDAIILRNNVFNNTGSGYLTIVGYPEVTGNTFIGGNPAIEVNSGGVLSDTPIYENTFDSCTNAIRFTGDSVATIYLNEFIDVGTVATWMAGSGSATASTWQSPAMDYTLNGVTLNGPLGNYYSDYTGVDNNSDGIGDTAVDHGDQGTDSYPLVAPMEDGGFTTMQTLADMTVDQVAGETYKYTPYDNPDEEYTIDSMTDIGVLIASGIEFEASDRYYGSMGSFWIDGMAGIDNEPYSATEVYYNWYIYINDVKCETGLGNVANTLVNDSKVSFYYAPTVGTDEDIAGSLYAIHLTANEIDYPVIAQRDIKNQNFYEELLTNYDLVSTKVTVTLTAREDIDSLTFEEVIPAGWTITPSEDDEAVFKQNLNETNRYEWVWTDKMDSGESKTVVYTLTLPKTAAGGDYPVEGTCSAYVGDTDHDDIPVVGDNNVNVSDTDWNPWNDVDSDGGAYITTDELQSAINCWLEDLTVPGFSDEYVTTDRLQMLVHYWVQNAECPEGADV